MEILAPVALDDDDAFCVGCLGHELVRPGGADFTSEANEESGIFMIAGSLFRKLVGDGWSSMEGPWRETE